MAKHNCECGLVWEVTQHKYPMRDKDSISCNCGREIMRWNGGVFYTAERLKDTTSNNKTPKF